MLKKKSMNGRIKGKSETKLKEKVLKVNNRIGRVCFNVLSRVFVNIFVKK